MYLTTIMPFHYIERTIKILIFFYYDRPLIYTFHNSFIAHNQVLFHSSVKSMSTFQQIVNIDHIICRLCDTCLIELLVERYVYLFILV